MDDFVSWLLQNMENRDWSQAETARRAGITRSAISKIIAGHPPGTKVCDGLAMAFRLPPDEVYQIAGILPSSGLKNKIRARADYLFRQLNPEDQREILDFINFKLESYKNRDAIQSKHQIHKSKIPDP